MLLLESQKEIAAVGVTGIWGIAEGANVAFSEKGFEVYTLGKVVSVTPKQIEPCIEGFVELDGKCWKIDFGDLKKSKKVQNIYTL